jgi:hypothetical protein
MQRILRSVSLTIATSVLLRGPSPNFRFIMGKVDSMLGALVIVRQEIAALELERGRSSEPSGAKALTESK